VRSTPAPTPQNDGAGRRTRQPWPAPRRSDGARRRPFHPPNVCGFDWRRNDRARKAGSTLEAEHFASLACATCRPPATANRATADTSSHTLALSVRAGRDSCATHRCRCAHETNSMFGAPKRKQIFAGCVTYVWSPWKLVECDLARKEVTGACVGVRRRQGSPCREESGRQDLAGPHDQKKGHRKFQL
jgi:hypothetical protein